MLFYLMLFGFVIGSNNLAAAIALGSMKVQGKRWTIVLIFGFFETLVAWFGLASGHYFSYMITGLANLISSSLLLLLGIYTIISSLYYSEHLVNIKKYIASTKGIVLLAMFLSVDNLIAGLGLGLNRHPPLLVAASTGVFSMIFTYIGLIIGAGAKGNREKPAGIVSGSLLIFLAAVNYFGWI